MRFNNDQLSFDFPTFAPHKKIKIMKSITIEGQLRTESGKKATRQLRSQELVPGVIYGGKQKSIFLPRQLLLKALFTPRNLCWQTLK